MRGRLILPALEIAILTLGAALALRVALKPPVLRDFRAYLPWSAAVAIVGVAAVAGAVWLALRWPVARHAGALVTATLIVGARIRALPDYGRGRGWPPGSLGIAESFDAIGDRDYYRDRVRRYGPVFKTGQFGRPVVCVYGLELGRDVLRDDEALVGAPLPYDRFLPGGTLRYMDARVHDAAAPFFRTALGSVDLERHERRARATCVRMLAGLSRRSLERADGAAPREDLRRWVFTVLASVFWGFAPDDPRLAELDDARRELQVARGGGPGWMKEIRSGFERMERLLRRRASDPDFADTGGGRGSALGVALDTDAAFLDDPSRTRNLALVFRLGMTDATSLLDWVVAMLVDHPDWQTRVRAEGRSAPGRHPVDRTTAAGRFVHETIRLEQSEYLYREVARPISIAGYHVPKGWLLRVLVQESHRDPEIFPDPDRFDPDRFRGPPRSRREFSPFGMDQHGCMGVPFVHFLARILVEEMCHGYETHLLRDAPPEKGTRHRDHWRPASARRIRLEPLADSGR